MTSYVNTGESLVSTGGKTLDVYAKDFPQGTINLGANHGDSGSSMYTAAIVGQGGGTPPPADTTPPSTPENFNALAQSSTQINLNWNASTDNVGIKEYQISRNGDLIATTSSTGYTDNELTPDTTYNYSVVAMDDAKNSSSAATDSATTNAETTTPPSTGTATLSWNPNLEPDLAGYLAYIGTSSHNYTMTKDAGMTSNNSNPSFTVDDLTKGEMYHFAISAYDQNGNESPLSNEVEKMVQ
jgi:chitodextrinase